MKQHLRVVAQAVPTPDAPQPWAAVVRWEDGDGEISRAPAATKADAETMVAFCMRALVTYAHRDDAA
jgi:hypothetical protein